MSERPSPRRYVPNREGRPPGRFGWSISYDPARGRWEVTCDDASAESVLGSDAATPCDVAGWECAAPPSPKPERPPLH